MTARRRSIAASALPFLAASAVAGATAAGATPPRAGGRTSRDGVYTAVQAARGEQVYRRACAGCHPLDLYKGDAMEPWDGASLLGLFDLIATRMPPANPGSLKRREYADIVAYLLRLNGMPAGAEELAATPDVLHDIRWSARP